MHEAYAIIYTTFHVIGALAVIGLVCWQVGRIRARILWNLEDEVCDVADECIYIAHRRAHEAVLLNSAFDVPIHCPEAFDTSDIDDTSIESCVKAYAEGIEFNSDGGTWFCSESEGL